MDYVDAKKPLKVKHPRYGDLEISHQYPSVATTADLVAWAGEEKANKFVKSKVRQSATNAMRSAANVLKDDEKLSKDDFIAKLQEVPLRWKIGSRAEVSTAARASGFDFLQEKLKAMAESGAAALSPDDIQKLLAEALATTE